jgi:hypothetical protein
MEFTEVADLKDRKLHFNLYEVTGNFNVEGVLDSLIPKDEKTK